MGLIYAKSVEILPANTKHMFMEAELASMCSGRCMFIAVDDNLHVLQLGKTTTQCTAHLYRIQQRGTPFAQTLASAL